MSKTENTLPEELHKEIQAKAIEYRGDMHCVSCDGEETGYMAGATEYAQYKVKYEQAMAILKFNHPVLYNEIKTFLDGSK